MMARGKYKNAAEARRVREDAIGEASRLRRENEHLVQELEAARLDLNSTLETMHGETARLRRLVVAGTTEEMSALKSEVQELEARLADARREVGLEVADIFRMHSEDLPLPAESGALAALLKTLGITPAEFFIDQWSNNRRDRRTTASQVRRNWEENVGWGSRGKVLRDAGGA